MVKKTHTALSPQEKEFYSRQIRLTTHGIEGQLKLKNSAVLIIGAGGLGVPALQYLAGMGVGRIGIMDADEIAVHNLHRQVIYGLQDVGRLKVAVATEFVAQLNPYITVETHSYFLDSTHGKVISDYDLIIDATDNFKTRYIINDLCVIEDKPFIYAGVFEEEAQLAVLNYHGGPSYRCLYPAEPNPENFPSCVENGIMPYNPGLIGLMQAKQAISVLLNRNEESFGKLLMIDWATMSIDHITFNRNPDNFDIEELKRNLLQETNDELSWVEVNKLDTETVFLIDIRSHIEYLNQNIGDQNIEMEVLTQFANSPQKPHNISPDVLRKLHDEEITKVIYCQSGRRSENLLSLFRMSINENVVHIKGGLNSHPGVD